MYVNCEASGHWYLKKTVWSTFVIFMLVYIWYGLFWTVCSKLLISWFHRVLKNILISFKNLKIILAIFYMLKTTISGDEGARTWYVITVQCLRNIDCSIWSRGNLYCTINTIYMQSENTIQFFLYIWFLQLTLEGVENVRK